MGLNVASWGLGLTLGAPPPAVPLAVKGGALRRGQVRIRTEAKLRDARPASKYTPAMPCLPLAGYSKSASTACRREARGAVPGARAWLASRGRATRAIGRPVRVPLLGLSAAAKALPRYVQAARPPGPFSHKGPAKCGDALSQGEKRRAMIHHCTVRMRGDPLVVRKITVYA